MEQNQVTSEQALAEERDLVWLPVSELYPHPGEITRSYGLIGRIEAFCREYAELDKLYRRGKSVKVEVLIEGGEFPLADIFVDPCTVYVAAEVLREGGHKKVSRRLWESAMEQLQTIGDFAEGA